MKSKFFYLAAGALALTACTSEDVINDVEKSRNAISFENVVNKPSRADDITGANLKQFNVFGFYTTPTDPTTAVEIFDDVLVKRDGVKWYYTPTIDSDENLRYWVKDARYYFYAYNCGNANKLSGEYGKFNLNMANTDKTLTAADRVLTIEGYRCDNSHQHDLIYASNVGGNNYEGILGLESGNAAVALQFKHILSKVNVRFSSKFPSDYTVMIKNVSIQNIRNYGDYHPVTGWQRVWRNEGDVPYINLSTAAVDAEGNPTNITIVNGLDEQKNQLTVSTGTGFVIPYGYKGEEGTESTPDTQVYLTFDIEAYNQGAKVLSKSLTATFNPIWLAGYFYTYNVVLSGSSTNMDAIVFTTATDGDGRVVDWQNDDKFNIIIDK